MHVHELDRWRPDHDFGHTGKTSAERRTLVVVVVTAVMMVVEITAGLVFGSMALLADGLHMGSHAAALGVAFFAYVYARKNARDERFSFGTGKVNALAGFSSALMLGGFALGMAWESAERWMNPVEIAFDYALIVAVVGLVVNAASIAILGGGHEHHGHDHHGHDHDHGKPADHDHHHHDESHGDQNLRGAYLHVVADALTSVFAIVALLAGKYWGAAWLDPAMGVVGAVLVAHWSIGLARQTARVLLDHQAPDGVRLSIVNAVEAEADNRITDLHVWRVAPNGYAVELALVTHTPRTANHYKSLLGDRPELLHVTVEVHHCDARPDDSECR